MENLTCSNLIALCRERKVKGYSGKKKAQLLELLSGIHVISDPPVGSPSIGNTYKVLSLFSGMAGLDAGFAEQVVVHRDSVPDAIMTTPHSIEGFVNLQRLPFRVVFQNDILPVAKQIAELNEWAHNYHLKDIRELIAENFTFPQADVIVGGFPCQDFSHAGKRQGLDASRGTLYQSYVEVVRRVKPLLFIAENVHGLLTMPGDPIKIIIADFTAEGYEVKYQLVKCEEYRIPQTRWRVIIMGVRSDKKEALPDDWNILREGKGTCPIRPYFLHLQEPTESLDLAQKAYSKAKRLVKGQGQKEIDLNYPAPTMRAEHHGNIEFRRVTAGCNKEGNLPERRLTVREAALIQTFPPDCKLTVGSKVSMTAYKPIGNAVPPLLGYFLARKVHELLVLMK